MNRHYNHFHRGAASIHQSIAENALAAFPLPKAGLDHGVFLQIVCNIMKTQSLFGSLLKLCALVLAPGAAAAAQLTAATMHPVLTDVAKEIGGDKVNISAIVPAGADVHRFSPTPSDVKKLSDIQVILVAGKGMETYLDKLRSNLSPAQQIVEVGRTIPSLKIEPGDETFMCCPEHAHGAIDPHWWNSVENMQRAGRVIADVFAEKDPANKDYYRDNAAAWSKRLGELKKWAKKEISAVPPERRKLATAHLSLSYFVKEFGFKLVPVQGLNHNANATPAELAAAIKVVREQKIVAVFPEQGVNPKYLNQLAAETGVKVGPELIADGNGTGKHASFEAAFTYNVQTIVAALKP
jgi:zinc/manganese transport system substrate-binding protein